MEKEKNDFKGFIKVLMELDEKSLLLIESGARLLAARQAMENESSNNQLQKIG